MCFAGMYVTSETAAFDKIEGCTIVSNDFVRWAETGGSLNDVLPAFMFMLAAPLMPLGQRHAGEACVLGCRTSTQ